MSFEQKSIFSRIDSITLLLYLVLVFIGLTAVFSVEYRSTDPSVFMMNKNHNSREDKKKLIIKYLGDLYPEANDSGKSAIHEAFNILSSGMSNI